MTDLQPNGSWRGHKLLWMRPDDEPARSDATLEITPNELTYTWAYEGTPHTGVMRLSERDGQAIVEWKDSFHASTGMRFEGTADAGGFVVNGSYSDGQGGPDWGWRIEFTAGALPVVRMFNILPSGEEALAVDLRAEE